MKPKPVTKLFSGLTRSELMSRIRSRGNKKTELALLDLLRKHKLKGWRRHQPLPGTPDFVFRKERLALFVDGCFWHGCLMHSSPPVKNRAFWKRKLDANKTRDRKVTRTLRSQGWRVLRIWEHDLRREQYCVNRILRALSHKKA